MTEPARDGTAAGERATSPAEWVFRNAARTPRADALDAPGLSLPYGALAERVAVLAGDLATRGAAPGDRIAVALPLCSDAAIATLAVHALGACAVDLDPATPPRALAAILAVAAPRFAILDARDAPAWTAARAGAPLEWAWAIGPRLPPGTLPARGTTPLFPGGEPAVPARPIRAPRPVAAAEPALVVVGAGSARGPRAIVLTYANLEAHARALASILGLGAADRMLAVLPFHYSHGRAALHAHLLAGGSAYVEPRFRFPRVAIETLGVEECTGLVGSALSFELLRRELDVREFPAPALRWVTQAGGTIDPATLAWARAAFAPARVLTVYGQEEATACYAFLPPERAQDKEGALGIPLPGVELRIVDDAGRERPRGEIGHLVVRGPTIMPGYLGAPAETTAVLRDGWLTTGVLARRDEDGYVFPEGRAREVLDVGGCRVSPGEIEAALASDPAVAEAAVVGAPDALAGEVAVAFVVLRRDASATEDHLRRVCLDALGRKRVPARVVVVEELPRTASGRPLRPALRDRARGLANGVEA